MAEHTNPFQDETDAYRRDLDALLAELPGSGSQGPEAGVTEAAADTGEAAEKAPAAENPETPEDSDAAEPAEPETGRNPLKRLRARKATPEADAGKPKTGRHGRQADPDAEARRAEEKAEVRRARRERRKKRRAANRLASAQLLGDHPRLRTFLVTLVTLALAGVVLLMALSRLVSSDVAVFQAAMDAPQRGIAAVMAPIQNAFSGVTNAVADVFRRIRLAQNIEEEYDRLYERYEQIVYDAARTRELEIQLSQFENINDEIRANAQMQPLVARVTGREEGNYFSVFTINRGSADGVQPYMAVTISGALVGYTETVESTSATVRTIIDSEASIAALIQSSRDQGTVRGTLGIDGTAMCRMYYLPDDHLPRPGDIVVTSGVGMSFPKGIPIGTVRESTRGMQSNKQYIVVEPTADFQHLEYVIVLLYQPDPEAVQSRSSLFDTDNYETPEPNRPVPTLSFGSMNYFGVTEVPQGTDTPGPQDTETPTPGPTSGQTPLAIDVPTPSRGPVFEYIPIDGNPTPTPTITPTPSPTPNIILLPENMTIEEG